MVSYRKILYYYSKGNNNRIYPPFDKKTFILDFVNTIDEIEKAFKPYYTTTLLCNMKI